MLRSILFAALLLPGFSSSAHSAERTLPAEPPRVRELRFEEAWRTDPDSEDYLMGNVQRAVVDGDGNYYFLDVQLQEVFKFGPAGQYLGTVAQKGEGPGELEQTWQIDFWPPGEIVLPRLFPPRIVRVALDGTPLDDLRVYRSAEDDTPASVGSLHAAGDLAVVDGSMFQFSSEGSKSVSWLGVIDRTGLVQHEFGYRERDLPSDPMNQLFDEKAEFWEWGRWAVSSEGYIFRAPDRESWMIERFDLSGELELTLRRDIRARARTDEEFEEMLESRAYYINGRKAEVRYELLDTEPPITGLSVVGDRLFVFQNVVPGTLAEGVWRRADVLTLDGELLEQVDVVVPHDEENDFVFLLSNGQVLVIENGVGAMRSQFAAIEGDSEGHEGGEAEPAVLVIYSPAS